MFIKRILDADVQDFISEQKNEDIAKVILKGSPFAEISIQELANQVISKHKSEQKLPTWFKNNQIYYPKKISIEQTSSEITANYKSILISGEKIIDLTGGFGIDCFYFSKVFKKVIHCEINEELSEIVTHNYKVLQIKNIQTIVIDGIAYLKNTKEKFDYIYVDPSRRNESKGKVFLLKDCLPNIPKYLDLLFSKTDRILIKNSPMLDIAATIKQLCFVKEIHVVAINNDVKELLILLEKEYEEEIKIKTINYTKRGEQLFEYIYKDFSLENYIFPQKYLYEPNSAILKSGGFNQLSEKLGVGKLQQHAHLYTSDQLIDFPGRRFKIMKQISYGKKEIKKYISEGKANITTRNFPKTVAQIRKETKLKDGGDWYLFFTKNKENKNIVLLCKSII